jgi:hypothetical protein
MNSCEPREVLAYARRKTSAHPAVFGHSPVILEDGTPSDVEWMGEITCGDNPWIHARLVANVRPASDAANAQLLWDEVPGPAELDLREIHVHRESR